MKKTFRILLLTFILTGQLLTSFADRGIGKKKAKVMLNIKMPASFQSSLNFNLRNGLKYTGSLANNNTTKAIFPYSSNMLITYQKGNSIYILPYKQKVLVADVIRQGYAGTKLIIKMR
jgi:hypothetical protein